MIPEAEVPTDRLGNKRLALVDGDTTFDRGSKNGGYEHSAYTLADTAGCSCEQILSMGRISKNQTRFGCSESEIEFFIDY